MTKSQLIQKLRGQGYTPGYDCPSGALYFKHPDKFEVCIPKDGLSYEEGFSNGVGFQVNSTHRLEPEVVPQ